MTVTLKDIADRAGVSVATTSRVMRGVGRINAETADRVRAIASELGYWKCKSLAFPAANYRGKADHTLRILLARSTARSDSQTKELDDRFEKIVGDQLARLDARFEVLSLGDPERFEAFMQSFRPHGVILLSIAPRNWLSNLSKRVAVVGTADQAWQSGIDSIDVNEQRAAAEILQCLRDLGHRYIVDYDHPSFTASKPLGEMEPWQITSMTAEAPRQAAWSIYTLRDAAPMVPNMVLVPRQWGIQSLEQTMDQTIDRVFAIKPTPTAIVVGSAICAVTLVERLQERGVRVPEDVGVVAYGGGFTERPPHLTTLRLPVAEMAQLAPEVIQRRVADPDALPLSLRLDGQLVMGRTLVPLDQMKCAAAHAIASD